MNYKSCLVLCVAFGYANLSYATVTVFEPFNYGPAGSVVSGNGGGGSFGFSDNWHGDATVDLASGSLTSPVPFLSQSGNRVTAAAFGDNRGVERTLSQSIGADNTTAYVSFLMQAEGVVGAGAYDGWFALALRNGARQITIGKDSFHSQYKIEGLTNTDLALTSVPVIANQTHLFVVRADFLPGNDVFRLYVDPPTNQPEPASANATMTSFDLGNANVVGLTGPGAFGFDELRIGSTWSDVTVPEPTSSMLLLAGLVGPIFTARRRSLR